MMSLLLIHRCASAVWDVDRYSAPDVMEEDRIDVGLVVEMAECTELMKEKATMKDVAHVVSCVIMNNWFKLFIQDNRLVLYISYYII